MAVVSAPYSSNPTLGRSGWRDLDWWLLMLVVTLSVWGCWTITSASLPTDDMIAARAALSTSGTSAAPGAPAASAAANAAARVAEKRGGRLTDPMKQALWIVAGLVLLALVTLVDFQLLIHLMWWIYGANIVLLLAVLRFGRVINGARSWIPIGPFALQPAEFAKFAVIITLAAFLCVRQDKMRDFSTVLWSLAFLAPPLLLILKQPDFGTMLAVGSIWFGMLFFGGARLWHLGLILGVGAAMFIGLWKTNHLKEHQKERLAVFLDTDPSPRGAGYQVKQSQIAIGSGQISGEGWGRGIQNRAGYVPEKTTDFIFAVVAEETGFAGAATLIVLYLFLLFRSTYLAMTTDNYFGALMAGGFTTLVAFHAIINLGMTMRVMPITGVPLPFFSYGGSSYLAFSLCVGLLQSVALRRKRIGAL